MPKKPPVITGLLTADSVGNRWQANTASQLNQFLRTALQVPSTYNTDNRPAPTASLLGRFIIVTKSNDVSQLQVCLLNSKGLPEWVSCATSS